MRAKLKIAYPLDHNILVNVMDHLLKSRAEALGELVQGRLVTLHLVQRKEGLAGRQTHLPVLDTITLQSARCIFTKRAWQCQQV
jgi:hypothetical protein